MEVVALRDILPDEEVKILAIQIPCLLVNVLHRYVYPI